MSKTAELVAEIAKACDAEVGAAHEAVGNAPDGTFQGANEAQVGAVVDRLVAGASNRFLAAFGADVREAMKEGPYSPKKAKK